MPKLSALAIVICVVLGGCERTPEWRAWCWAYDEQGKRMKDRYVFLADLETYYAHCRRTLDGG